jgi:hypothetical protein
MTRRKRKPKTVTTRRLRLEFAWSIAAVAAFLCALTLAPKQRAFAASPGEQAAKNEKPYALIYGTVYGPDDRSVYGVKVKIRRLTDKKPRWELYSDHSGEFAQRVPAGKTDYVIWADLKGYKSPVYKSLRAGQEVTVHIENDERTDISLHLK